MEIIKELILTRESMSCVFVGFLLTEVQKHLEENDQETDSLKTKCIFFLRVLCHF